MIESETLTLNDPQLGSLPHNIFDFQTDIQKISSSSFSWWSDLIFGKFSTMSLYRSFLFSFNFLFFFLWAEVARLYANRVPSRVANLDRCSGSERRTYRTRWIRNTGISLVTKCARARSTRYTLHLLRHSLRLMRANAVVDCSTFSTSVGFQASRAASSRFASTFSYREWYWYDSHRREALSYHLRDIRSNAKYWMKIRRGTKHCYARAFAFAVHLAALVYPHLRFPSRSKWASDKYVRRHFSKWNSILA